MAVDILASVIFLVSMEYVVETLINMLLPSCHHLDKGLKRGVYSPKQHAVLICEQYQSVLWGCIFNEGVITIAIIDKMAKVQWVYSFIVHAPYSGAKFQEERVQE